MSDFSSVQNDNYYGNEYDGYGDGARKNVSGVRPMVDPHATGEVDVGNYPEPKDSTKKIRGRYDFLDMVFTNVNQELLIAKTFYFFFFSAFGSLFPLMGIYFKQMGMNPLQCGVLIGLRPFIEFPSAPFWGNVADRYRKGKIILMTSLSAWIIFTSSLSFIQPPAVSCVIFNSTHHILTNPNTHEVLKRSIAQDYSYDDDVLTYQNGVLEVEEPQYDTYTPQRRSKRDTPLPKNHVIGKSPHRLEFTVNYNENEHETFVSPPFSTIVYRYQDVQKVFFLAFLLIVLGEFFSCPAITLADSAVITYLGDEVDKYGRQRMFGSVGWGICMFFVGIALDHSTAFPDHPCGPHEQERNYTICFAVFSVLMGCALITATQMKFDYGFDESLQMSEIERKKKEEEERAAKEAQAAAPNVRTRIDPNTTVLADDTLGYTETASSVDIGKSEVFAQTSKEFPQWVTFLKQFHNVRSGTILFVAWWMGFGIGLIFTFLFWHLQDYGGTPTLFGVASVINHISEIFAYFFSFRLITQIGHVKVLCLGLTGNVLRFLYISWIRNPWWVLPFEFIQGITHAAVWAACCSYLAHTTAPEMRASAQGVLQGLHHGLGRGCGAVIGGLMVNYFGTQVTFRGYGVMSLLVLALFVFINFFRQGQFQTDIPQTEDPHQVAESGHLDPHGVPANPMPRALSSSRLQDLEQQNYGATTHSGTHLEAPNAGNNPFLSAGNEGNFRQYAGNNYDQLENQLTCKYGVNASLAISPEGNIDQEGIAKTFQEYEAVIENINPKNPFLTDIIQARAEPNYVTQAGW